MDFLQLQPLILAQATAQDVANNVVVTFNTSVTTMGPAILKYAVTLFWSLGLISLVWTGTTLVIKKGDLMDFLGEFAKFCIFLGFFYWLLNNGITISKSILSSFNRIAADASGSGISSLNNGGELFRLAEKAGNLAFDRVSVLDFGEALIWVCIGLIAIILGCYALVVILVAICSNTMLCYAGIFVLGFGGSRWTSDIAISFYKTVIAAGLKLLIINLLCGVAIKVMNKAMASNMEDLQDGITVMATLIVVALLLDRVPNLIAGIVSGSSFNTPGSAYGGIAAVGGLAGGIAAQVIAKLAERGSDDDDDDDDGEGKRKKSGSIATAKRRVEANLDD